MSRDCPCCGGQDVRVFYEVHGVPVNSVLTLPVREEALGYPTGDIDLGFCGDCGFIYNAAFEPSLLEYSHRYDPTQAFSPTFNKWHRELAEQLIDRYSLHGRKVIEIGCGKGEFLNLLCELGDVTGVGFDPAFEQARNVSSETSKATFVSDFYGEDYGHVSGDLVCCKMTLEHIRPARSFVDTVRRSVGDRIDTAIFFQVPDVLRILEETAFWDIYYEHCSYYSMGSLARLFRRCGFDVLDVAREFDDQYLMIDARPSASEPSPPLPQEDDIEQLAGLVERFDERLAALKRRWQKELSERTAAGKKTVIWGSGSKGVAFLTTLGVSQHVSYVVDINPHRQGNYMLGTGQEIVGPDFLKEYRPDTVVIMNPIYRDEIVADLRARGLEAEVLTT